MIAASEMEVDAQARVAALAVERSFLVKAPAGSGKTQLLTLRLLALLSKVNDPEEILAITFTKAATAEMRERVLSMLRRAAAGVRPADDAGDDLKREYALAKDALEHARERGWQLLEQPHLLNIQTIDSLCMKIAHGAPLLAKLGGHLQPTDDAQPLYALAARRTVERLREGNTELAETLKHLLRLRDVLVGECESLIAAMLERRDEWLGMATQVHLHEGEDGWRLLRERLEEPFRNEHARAVGRVKKLLNHKHGEQLLELAKYACSNDVKAPIHGLKGLTGFEELSNISHYLCLRHFTLNKSGEWFKKKAVNKTLGFPTTDEGGLQEPKRAFQQLLAELSSNDPLREALCALDSLPEEQFTEEEWRTVRSVFTILLHAAAELRVVFAEKAVIDFVELGITAATALEDPEERRRWSTKIHHLLVDEFQDTSRRQYELVRSIVSEWEAGEERSCFLVGDPMQSVYLFRQADLALFKQVQKHGLHTESGNLVLEELTLRRNFRSDAGIVNPLNKMFTAIGENQIKGAVEKSEFTAAVANEDSSQVHALHVHAHFTDDGSDLNATEVEEAVKVIERHLLAIEQARRSGTDFRVGVLVRARKHVTEIARALRAAGIGYRAIEIETLEERQEVRDLLSLVRALLSPMDRVAWLSVLRAPWCGLSLSDLHQLSGGDEPRLLKKSIPELLQKRLDLLSEDGKQRAVRTHSTMQMALRHRFSGEFSTAPNGFAAWIERTWHTLGGPYCVDANQLENVQAFFRLLATMTPDGMEAEHVAITRRLERFYAQPGTDATEKTGVQLMTIHKAKGLGFDVVIAPGLERKSGRTESPLLQWMARTRMGSDERELLLAPIGNKGDGSSPTYKWVAEQRKNEEREEWTRLLYVACTRARKELHLSGSIKIKNGKMEKPDADSLLKIGWTYLEEGFEQQLAEVRGRGGPILVATHRRVEAVQPGSVLRMAAESAPNILSLRRLPADWEPPFEESVEMTGQAASPISFGLSAQGLIASAAGVAAHALLQQISGLPEEDARRDLSIPETVRIWKNIAAARLRQEGLGTKDTADQAARIITMLQSVTQDPAGKWILSPRSAARSESAWTMVENGVEHAVRADRVFTAGDQPLSNGESHLWIVDYKTTDLDSGEGILLDERSRHEPQLAMYGRVLQAALGPGLPLRLALYYPAIPYLDWWPG